MLDNYNLRHRPPDFTSALAMACIAAGQRTRYGGAVIPTFIVGLYCGVQPT